MMEESKQFGWYVPPHTLIVFQQKSINEQVLIGNSIELFHIKDMLLYQRKKFSSKMTFEFRVEIGIQVRV